MILLTYDTPRPRPGTFPGVPDTVDDLPDLPEPLPEEEPGEWGDPITVNMPEDLNTPDDDPDDTPLEEDGPEVAIDEDEVPPARGPESEPP